MITEERAKSLAIVRNVSIDEIYRIDREWNEIVVPLRKYDLSGIRIVKEEK